jgi:phage terminase large subunit-like protein
MLIPSWIADGSEIPDPFGYGERAVQWLRRLKHPKSKAVGRAFQLDPWQERVIRKLYGPRKPDGSRIVRRLVLLLPRGNRKTSLCAAITLLHLIGPERQPGNLIVSAASAREQARELFNEAALIVTGDKRLSSHLRIKDYQSEIGFPKDRSRYVAVANAGHTQHGKTPNLIIADELHAWEGAAGRKQWEALDFASVKVPGVLMIVATTSGRGQENLAWTTVEYAMKVQRGEIDDPATLPVLFMAEEGDDWRDEAVWHAINPGMEHGYPDLSAFRDKAHKAILSPPDRDGFMQYNLNRWMDYSAAPFVEMSAYDQPGNAAPIDLDALAGKPCWLGVDLSSNGDLTAIVAAWRDGSGGYIVQPWFFCPADNLQRKADKDGAPYPLWADQGFINPTPGNVVDYRAIADTIRELASRYDVKEIAYDPYGSAQIMVKLAEEGLPCVSFQQGMLSMAPATKELERAILAGQLHHGAHPVLRWNFDNIAVEKDAAGNVKFSKAKSRDKIDGAVAAAMAVARAAAGEETSIIYNNLSARPQGIIWLD